MVHFNLPLKLERLRCRGSARTRTVVRYRYEHLWRFCLEVIMSEKPTEKIIKPHFPNENEAIKKITAENELCTHPGNAIRGIFGRLTALVTLSNELLLLWNTIEYDLAHPGKKRRRDIMMGGVSASLDEALFRMNRVVEGIPKEV